MVVLNNLRHLWGMEPRPVCGTIRITIERQITCVTQLFPVYSPNLLPSTFKRFSRLITKYFTSFPLILSSYQESELPHDYYSTQIERCSLYRRAGSRMIWSQTLSLTSTSFSAPSRNTTRNSAPSRNATRFSAPSRNVCQKP